MTEQETKIAELEELNLLLNKENEMLKKKISEQTQSACAGVMPKIAEVIERLQELQSLYNENEPQNNAFGIAVNEIKRIFHKSNFSV